MHIYRLFEQQQKHHRVRKYRNQRNQGLVKFDTIVANVANVPIKHRVFLSSVGYQRLS